VDYAEDQLQWPKPFDIIHITQARKQTLPPSERTLYYTSVSV